MYSGLNSYSSALALDAADGVIDGRFYGSRIGGAGYNSALALDAADGVIDGRFFGARIESGAPIYQTASYNYGYGLAGATSALSVARYPTIPTYSAVAPAYASVNVVAVPQVVYAAPRVEYIQAPPVQYIEAPPVQYVVQTVQAPPEIRYIQSPPEIRYIEAPPKPEPEPAPVPAPVPFDDGPLRRRIAELEELVATLRMQLHAKQELKSQTNVSQTYKVKTFEIAAKLAVMDGTDDGLYNGLPIEVEGEGLYRDLVAMGRKPRANVSLTGRTSSMTTTSETYKVQSFEMAEKLSKMDGTDDGKYNGLPIEVAGHGLYTDLLKARFGH